MREGVVDDVEASATARVAADAPTATSTRPEPGRHRHRDARSRALLTPAVLAAAGGVLIALAFAPIDAWPLAPVGVALVTLAVRGRSARTGLLLGLLVGLGTFVPLLAWLRVVGVDGWLGLALIEAVL